jgi:kynurenine formamidase
MGALNLITPEKTRRAAALVKEGVRVSCSRPINTDSGPEVYMPAQRFMWESGEGWDKTDKRSEFRVQAALEYIGMVYHGFHITHIDTTSHFFFKGQMYNGHPMHLVSTNKGATVCSVDAARNGIVTRGVLVDVPMLRGVKWLDRDEGVMPGDILAAEKECGFKVEPGDVLLVRTGQLHSTLTEGPVDPRVSGSTACQAACLPLFHERDIAMLGSDTPNDMVPSGYKIATNPVHQVGIVAMGIWMLDNANLEDLAQACRKRNRWEFMLTMGPLRVIGGTGSPVNPIAIF